MTVKRSQEVETSAENAGLVARTLSAIELLAFKPQDEAELASQLGVHRRTAQRLIAQMVTDGWATRMPSGDRYTATLKLAVLAGYVMERTDVARMADRFVVELRRKTGESAHLCVPGEHGAIHIVNDLAEGAVIVRDRLGEIAPYHSTAVGKVLLAYDVSLSETVLGKALERFTENTIVDTVGLRSELARVRKHGYAVDEREHTLDLRCIAAPVRDHRGVVIAALGISAPSMRFSDEQLAAALGDTTQTAEELSEALGFDVVRRRRDVPAEDAFDASYAAGQSMLSETALASRP
jgi:IclR family transcriptional regulator, KDG regulon repressor